MTTHTIEDDRLRVRFDARTGGLVAIDDGRLGAWLEGTLAGSLFVVEIPRGGDRTVVVQTTDQTLSSAHQDEPAAIELRWDEPVSSTGERLDGRIVVRAAVTSGRLSLSMELSLAEGGVEAVRFPSIRGLRGPGELELRGVDYSTGTRVSLLPTFDSNAPYWGTIFPDYASGNLRPELVGNPTSPFIAVTAEQGGLTIMPAEPSLEFIGWRASLEPGYDDSLARTAPGDGAVTIDAIHFPVEGRDAVVLPTVVVAPYEGPWTASLDVPRENQRPTRRSAAAWLQEPRSWLQVQLMSTEGEPRYDFDDLVDIIEECARAGIRAVQVVGWNEGGQDGRVPWHVPAEKLGGLDGLLRALQRAKELDVATVLYVKYVWVEKPGPHWDDLAAWVSRDPNGQPYAQPGPVYHTARKRYGISTPWYVPLCFGVAELRRRIADEVALMAEWGADGVLADESLYHGRALLCFADDHGHEPGVSAFTWDAEWIADIRSRLGDRADTFVIAAEGAYDAQFEDYDVSYFRSASAQHRPVGRMLRPDARIVTALTGFDDRSMVAQSVLYGYGMSLEPYNFKGRPADMPLTVARAVAADGLRARLADWLWNGHLVVDGRAQLRVVEGAADLVSHTEWRDADDSARVVVVGNMGAHPVDVILSGLHRDCAALDLRGTPTRLHEGRVTVPAHDAVVVAPSPLIGTP